MKNIYNLFFRPPFKYYEKFDEKRHIKDQKPVFLIFDNELNDSEKPIKKFINFSNINNQANINLIQEQHYLNIDKNLYLVTHQLMNGKNIMEIEDLFDKDVLNVRINNKSFNRDDDADREATFGKAIFADYIAEHYKEINFENFKPMLDIISTISNKEIDVHL